MPMLDIQPTTPRLTRLGIIRLGIKKTAKSGKEYPSEVDHFVLRDAPDLVPAYGEDPDELYIYLPFDTVDENLQAWHELWFKRGLVCRGNGRHIEKLVKNGAGIVIRDGEVVQGYQDSAQSGVQPTFNVGDKVDCPGLNHNLWARCRDCRPSMRLFVMVRDPERPTQLVGDRLGYYQINTGSYLNYQNLAGQMMHALEAANAIGHPGLKGVPMILKRVEREVPYFDENGQHKSSTHWLLDLEFDVRWVQAANEALNHAALGMRRPAPPLPALVSEPQPEFLEAEIVDEEPEGDGEAEELDPRLADLLALADTPPEDWEAALAILSEFLGTAYDQAKVLRYARRQLELGRTESMPVALGWTHAVEYVRQQLAGA